MRNKDEFIRRVSVDYFKVEVNKNLEKIVKRFLFSLYAIVHERTFHLSFSFVLLELRTDWQSENKR